MKAQTEIIGIIFIALLIIIGFILITPTTQVSVQNTSSHVTEVLLATNTMCGESVLQISDIIRSCGQYCSCRDEVIKNYLDRMASAYIFSVEKNGVEEFSIQKGICKEKEFVHLPDREEIIVRFGTC